VEYSDETIVAMIRLEPELEGYGWCAWCRTFVEPLANGGERVFCTSCGRRAANRARPTPPPSREEDPEVPRGQVVRKRIPDPEDDRFADR